MMKNMIFVGTLLSTAEGWAGKSDNKIQNPTSLYFEQLNCSLILCLKSKELMLKLQ